MRTLLVILSSYLTLQFGSGAPDLFAYWGMRMLRMMRMLLIAPRGGDAPCASRGDPFDPLHPEHPQPLHKPQGSRAPEPQRRLTAPETRVSCVIAASRYVRFAVPSMIGSLVE
ncbi:hypothetical protein rosag_33590 [Roseisolibacter agri]|uniref:Uncharacterized protein n=1 Tax=Roseisolibacter agri TaxID=2014610 RepID=A0AA37V7M8_9BACT|nr:hypothetical protein rosag_33590 [Roseisolibacter agri]